MVYCHHGYREHLQARRSVPKRGAVEVDRLPENFIVGRCSILADVVAIPRKLDDAGNAVPVAVGDFSRRAVGDRRLCADAGHGQRESDGSGGGCYRRPHPRHHHRGTALRYSLGGCLSSLWLLFDLAVVVSSSSSSS